MHEHFSIAHTNMLRLSLYHSFGDFNLKVKLKHLIKIKGPAFWGFKINATMFRHLKGGSTHFTIQSMFADQAYQLWRRELCKIWQTASGDVTWNKKK